MVESELFLKVFIVCICWFVHYLCQKLINENDGYYENGKFFHHTSGDDRTKLYCVV